MAGPLLLRAMRVLGLDLGQRRIGMALSDEEQTFAFPLGALERSSERKDLTELAKLVDEHAVERVVLGLPIHMDGRSGPEAETARRFASALHERTGRPVDLIDERWSSKEAERALRESASRKQRRKRGNVDAVAASLILDTYLAQRRNRADRREGD